jgi:hypothetical protein
MFKFLKNLFLNLFKLAGDISIMSVPTPQSYVGKKIKAIPYDENNKSSYVPMLAIVDGSGNIIGYLPLAVTNNGDGTATIKVTN